MLGVSTRRVDDLVRALGIDGISKSEVSRMCAAPRRRGRGLPRPGRSTDERLPVPVARRDLPQGPRGGPGRVDGRARRDRRGDDRRAPGARARAGAGQRRGRGLAGASSAASSSAASTGVRLVISDDHRGLVKAVREQLLGAAWQRCRVHFTRNAQDLVPRARAEHGRLGHPLGLRAARRGLGPGAAAPGHRRPAPALPGGRRAARRGRGRPARPLHLPRDPSPPDPEHQPAGAAQQGDQAPHRGRRHLPHPGRRSSAWWAWSSPSRTTSGRTAGATSGPRRWPRSTRSPSRGGGASAAASRADDRGARRRAVTPRPGRLRSRTDEQPQAPGAVPNQTRSTSFPRARGPHPPHRPAPAAEHGAPIRASTWHRRSTDSDGCSTQRVGERYRIEVPDDGGEVRLRRRKG